MKKKILFTASIAKHILRFHLPYLEWFQQQGYETHVACQGDEAIPFVDKIWNVPFVRSPFSLGHFDAYKTLKKVVDAGNFSLIHCHTPMASVVTRLAAMDARKLGTKVLYTAHGFHFFKGGSLLNWLTYYPVEKYLSKFTDAIITINEEDYDLISEKEFKTKNHFLIPGVGVDSQRFVRVSEAEKFSLREQYGYAQECLILIYLAEFIERKNHEFIIDAIAIQKELFPNLKVLFAGRGKLEERLKQIVLEKNLTDTIQFLGFRNDVPNLIALSDVGFSSSKQEGLGLNLVEEMFCGLPILATIDRGHKELVVSGENGFLFEQGNQKQFIEHLKVLSENSSLRREMGEKAFVRSHQFSLENAKKEMTKIYNMFLS
jgi:glycosyltransferase EpsD